LLTKDGKIIYVNISTSKAQIDERDCNVGFFTDVTKRKQAEEKLQKSYKELKST